MKTYQRDRLYRTTRRQLLKRGGWRVTSILVDEDMRAAEKSRIRGQALLLVMDYLMASYFGVCNSKTVFSVKDCPDNVFLLPACDAMTIIKLKLDEIEQWCRQDPGGVLSAAGVELA